MQAILQLRRQQGIYRGGFLSLGVVHKLRLQEEVGIGSPKI